MERIIIEEKKIHIILSKQEAKELIEATQKLTGLHLQCLSYWTPISRLLYQIEIGYAEL